MFAVGISGLDLSGSTRYFDIDFTKIQTIKTIVNGSTISTTTEMNVILQPCEAQVWSTLNSNIKGSYNKIQMNQWLCPDVNTSLPLQGKFTSDFFKYSKISVSACTNLTGSLPCASKSQIDLFLKNNQGVITTNVYFINAVLNPGSEVYIDYYL